MADYSGQGLINHASQQFTGMKNIPGDLWANWPAAFSFSLVNLAAGAIINMIPEPSGLLGTVISAGINGGREVLQFVSWENLRVHSTS